jgi:modulator of FtsH protease HflC
MKKTLVIVAVVGLGLYITMSSLYTVSEVEQVILTQFGKPVGQPVTTAGLKVKVPSPGTGCLHYQDQ